VTELRRIIEPVARGRQIVDSRQADAGFTNTLLRVELDDGEVFAVKLYTRHEACVIETAHLASLRALAVPRVVHADSRVPVIIYPWIEARTLNEVRRAEPARLGALAEPIGRLLAELSGGSAQRSNPARVIEAELRGALARLRAGRARDRLGDVADRVIAMLEHASGMADDPVLVHGDFGGRNILVGDAITIVDWEAATTGSALWDVGSLFRYAKRYDAAFCADFARGYGGLPDGWHRMARILDATRLIEALDEDREAPGYHEDCRALLAALV